MEWKNFSSRLIHVYCLSDASWPEICPWGHGLGLAAVRAAGPQPGQDTWLQEDMRAGGTIICLVQFEVELTKTGSEPEILIFEQTWVLVKPQTHLQNSHNFSLSGRETGV